jgi:hypothetical protein
MRRALTSRQPRFAPLAAAAITAVIALAAAGCTEADGTTAATPSVTPSCASPDYCPPASWDTAKASTPLAQIPAFSEPLNVVISARSTVSLGAIQQAMGKWDTVSTATTVSPSGIHLKCISSEQADVTGAGYVPQHVAWRLGGCVKGNALSLTGDEDHARIWNQPFKGSKDGAWFIAVSYETLCLDRNGTLIPASTNGADETYAALHPSDAYHCVDGGPGSIRARHPNGYENGAATFAAAIASAAKAKGWHYSRRTVTVTRTAHAGEGGVPFNDDVDVLTVTA